MVSVRVDSKFHLVALLRSIPVGPWGELHRDGHQYAGVHLTVCRQSTVLLTCLQSVVIHPTLIHQEPSRGGALSCYQRTTKGHIMQTQAVDILQGPRPMLALRLPWYVDIIAMIVIKVEQGSRMGRVKNSLKDTASANLKTK